MSANSRTVPAHSRPALGGAPGDVETDWDDYLDAEPAVPAGLLELPWDLYRDLADRIDAGERIDEREVAERMLARLQARAGGGDDDEVAMELTDLPLPPEQIERIANDLMARAPRWTTFGRKAE